MSASVPRSARVALWLASGVLPFLALATVAAVVPPDASGALGSLRAWCGASEEPWSRLALVLPAIAVGAVGACLARPLLAIARERPRLAVAHAAAGAVLTIVLAASVVAREGAPAPSPVGSRPELDARLVDQNATPTRIRDLRGRVVLATGFYARCSTTCPMAFAQVHEVLAALAPEERAGLAFVGVTLDPAHDTTARLAELARGHGLASPGARLLAGRTSEVDAALDELGIVRRRDPASGLIEHEGAFVVLDRDGRVAARLPAGTRDAGAARRVVEAVRRELARGAGGATTVAQRADASR